MMMSLRRSGFRLLWIMKEKSRVAWSSHLEWLCGLVLPFAQVVTRLRLCPFTEAYDCSNSFGQGLVFEGSVNMNQKGQVGR